MLTVAAALDLLLTQLTEEYGDDPGMRVLAQPGESLITDWCGPRACAMTYVRLDTMGVSTQTFPDIDRSPSGRTGPLAATFHLGVARCCAVQDAQGNPPSPEQQTLEARMFLNDAARLRKVVACTLAASERGLTGKNTTLGAWTPQGPLGGCGGGFWPLTARVS